MTPNIEELITINYELEGLLYLALHRGDDTPQKVWDLIAEKIDALKSGVTAADCNCNVAGTVYEETPDMQEVVTVEENTIILEPETLTPATEATEEETEEPEELPQENDDAATVEKQETDDTDLHDVEVIIEETPAEITSISVEEEHIAEKPQPAEPVIEETPGEVKPVMPGNEPAQELRLDEKLARQNSRNLRKAFSLNDRFRFKRELFGNSDEKMNEALNLVESMHSIEEARDYFFNTLRLDGTSPDVKDFMAIVEHHLSSK